MTPVMFGKWRAGRQVALRKIIVRLWLTLRHRIFGRRNGRLTIEQIDDVPLIVLPQVFNPVLFRTGEFLVRAMESISFPKVDNHQPPMVLDLGCGSGVGSIFAARRGARVVAVDINPEAIRCVKMNTILNRLDDKIESRYGDLFEPVKNERFDLILFNPPFYRGQPKDNIDLAWRGENIFERFASGLDEHLTSNGLALIVLSTDGEGQSLLNELKARCFEVKSIVSRDFGNEVITVYQVNTLNRPLENDDHSL